MSILLTRNKPFHNSRARILSLVAVAGFALLALACGVETGAASNLTETLTPGGAVARTEDPTGTATGPAEAIEPRPEADSAASAAALPDASTPPLTAEKDEAPGADAPPETLKLSPELTDFTLPTGLGAEVTLSSYLGEQNVMVVFYRAWW